MKEKNGNFWQNFNCRNKTTIAKHQAKSIFEFQNEEVRGQLLEKASINLSKLLIGNKSKLFDDDKKYLKLGTI